MAPTTKQALYELMEGSVDNKLRTHLGASSIGDSCARKLWYAFRWIHEPFHEGRILRLFRRGQVEETFVVSDLNNLEGVEVRAVDPATGEQYRFTDPELPGFGGSVDGVAFNLPEAPGVWIGLEIKTHNTKNFAKLKKHGVQSFPRHWFQCQSYLFGFGLPGWLYLGVNKDTDELYTELVPPVEADQDYARMTAREVLESTEPPPKISQRKDWFECKFCDFYRICQLEEPHTENCRNCSHVQYAEGTDKWTCSNHNKSLNALEQSAGCEQYETNPAMKILG